ncbi:MAG: hypothetical protein JWM85_3541 [Acidimicrobiaceae bacterium]|nr:hypothetical protein [Acidimicrobiaceae bacterium]
MQSTRSGEHRRGDNWSRRPRGTAKAQPARDGEGLAILHLAFEEHRQPGSGGGGIRTREVNRRLASRHRITVVACPYPGARPRVEDGVAYRHLGLRYKWLGRIGRMITYHVSVPFFVLAHRADLVVEDFAAPMSSVAVPLFTRAPAVAVVQWMFARETSKKYRFPFFLAEELGVRAHRNFVAVSQYMASEILRRNPHAHVDTVYAGVPEMLRSSLPYPERAREILYLGRLQIAEKGLDLLLEAFTRVAVTDDTVRLLFAGDGYQADQLVDLIAQLGLAGRVEMLGRVDGGEKRDLLRRASVVAIPSRFESFGIVAAEALASGTPVVAFALPALQEIVSPDCGVLVEAFDTGAFAQACESILLNPERRAAMSAAARERAVRFDWDLAARAQEQAYLAAVGDFQRRRAGRAMRRIWGKEHLSITSSTNANLG